MSHRSLLSAATAGLALLAAAAPAYAAVTPTATLTPANTQAGGATDLSLATTFNTADNDDVKNLTFSFAPGLLANPSVATIISEADFNTITTATSAAVGSGSATLTSPLGPVNATVTPYLVAPTSATSLPRLGVVFYSQSTGVVIRKLGTISVRTTAGNQGLDVAFTDLPRQVTVGSNTVDVTLTNLNLTLNGQVNAKPFIRLPTSNSVATSVLTITPYDNGGNASANAPFTPTGADTLGYSPAVTATGDITPGSDGVAFTTSVTLPATDSANQSTTVNFPSGLVPRLTTLGNACQATTSAQLRACPAVGTVAVTTPLLPVALPGKVVLQANSGGFPRTVLVLSDPVPFDIVGTLTTSPTAAVTFAGLPDLPITKLDVTLNGGPTSALQASSSFCNGAQTVSGAFTAFNAKKVNSSSAVAVTGTCPAATTTPIQTTPTTTPVQTPTTGTTAPTLKGTGTATKLGSTPSVSLKLSVPGAAKTLTVTLPKGLTFVKSKAKKGLKVTAGGKTVKATLSGSKITLSKATAGSITVSFSKGLVKSSSSLKKSAKKGTVSLTFKVKAANGANSLSTSIKVKGKK